MKKVDLLMGRDRASALGGFVFLVIVSLVVTVLSGVDSRATSSSSSAPSGSSSNNVVDQEDAERLSITIDQTDCPETCIKSNNRCDRNCRTRYYSELGVMEMINLRESLALSRSTPALVQIIDQTKFCAQETVLFKTPSIPVALTNPQRYKGAFSDHNICTSVYGYTLTLVPTPPPTPTTPVDVTSITSDGCYEVVNRYERAIFYSNPTLVGPVRYTCKEDDKVKTLSWQLSKGCTVSWSGTVQNTGQVTELSRIQVGCFPTDSGSGTSDGGNSDGNGDGGAGGGDGGDGGGGDGGGGDGGGGGD